MTETALMDDYELEYGGFSFTLFIPDYWVKIYRGQKKEPLYPDYCKMLDVLKTVNNDKYVLDIGMNHGLFSVPASKLGYKVFGFEPIVANVYSLVKAKEANNLKYFDVFNLALSNKNGEVEMYVPECPDNSSMSSTAAVANMRNKVFEVEKVDAVRFDDWIKDNPKYKNVGFIKIDTQGAEYIIFEGMKEFLTNADGLYIIAEYEPHLLAMGNTYEQLDNLLISYGFHHIGNVSPNDKIFYKP